MLIPPTNDGATPVYIAAQNGHAEAKHALKELGAKETGYCTIS